MAFASVSHRREPAAAPIRAAPPASALLIWTAVVVAVGAGFGERVASTWLLALAVVAGLPHGAGDLERVRRMGAGADGWLSFLAGYLGLVALTLATWAFFPALALALFLLLSVIHFGLQDAEIVGGPRSLMAALAHGGAVVVVPAVAHPASVRELFAFLVGNRADQITSLLAGPAAVLWLGAVVITAFQVLDNRRTSLALPHLALIGLLFAVASPLVAFALYFAGLHTPRALASQRARLVKRPAPLRTAAVTGLACLLGLGIFLAGPHLQVDGAIVRTSFVLLAVLTVPHMALDYLAPRLARARSASPSGIHHVG